MPTAEELLAQMSESIPEHTHQVVDSDTYFIIDPVTREIDNTARRKNSLMQYDHESERFTFELARYVEGHDMTLCNSVKVHYINIDPDTQEQYADVADILDLGLKADDDNTTICSWLIRREATQLAGTLSFLVHYACSDENGELVYEWSSDIYDNIDIKPGRRNGEQAILEHSDLLEQWRAMIFGQKDSMLSEITVAGEEQKTDIQTLADEKTSAIETLSEANKAELQASFENAYNEIEIKRDEALESIPEDYTEVYNMANEALRTKADALYASKSGECIFFDDSSHSRFSKFNVYGRSIQDQTTGKNLCPPFVSGSIDIATGEASFEATGYLITDYIPIDSTQTYSVSGLDPSIESCMFFYSADKTPVGRNASATRSGIVLDTFATAFYGSLTNNDVAYMIIRSGGSNLTRVQVEVGSNMTVYEPYTEGKASPSPEYPQPIESVQNVQINVCGGNLFNFDAIESVGGITKNADGTVGVSMYASTTQKTLGDLAPGLIVGQSYRLLIDTNGEEYIYVGPPANSVWDNDQVLCVTADMIHSVVYLYCGVHLSGEGKPAVIRNISIVVENVNEMQDSYESPQTITLPYVLRSVGNVCDEIDFARGKFIKRIGHLLFDGSESWHEYVFEDVYQGFCLDEVLEAPYTRSAGYCNQFIPMSSQRAPNEDIWIGVNNRCLYVISTELYDKGLDAWKSHLTSNPLEIIYPLHTPIEHDLTPAERQACRDLRTNATDTTITNDQNVKMDVEYVVDLETWMLKHMTTKISKFDLTLPLANWVESEDKMYYSQPLDYQAKPSSRVDLHPTAPQLIMLINDGLSMFVANEDGVVTAYSIGGIPGADITIQATETVVVYV